MPRKINYNGTIHEFPDGTSDADVSEALKAYKPHPSPGRGGSPRADSSGTDPSSSFWKEAGSTAVSALPFLGATAATIGTEGILGPMLMAGLGGAAGKATQEAISPDVDSTYGLAKEVGQAGLEYGAGEGVGRGIGGVVKATLGKKLNPTGLFASALQPSKITRKPLTLAEVNALADTAAKYGVAPGERGMAELTRIREGIHQQTLDLLAKHKSNPNIFPITRTEVASRLSDVIKDFADPSTNALTKESADAIHGVGAEFLGIHPNPPRNPFIGLEDAQKMKSNIYRDLGSGKYGVKGDAQVESEKALARGLLEALATRVPEIRSLGLEESSVIKLQEQMAKMLGRERNKRITGLIPAVLMGGGALAGGKVGLMQGGMQGAEIGAGMGAGAAKLLTVLLDNPEIKGQLANVLRRGSGTAVGKAYKAALPYAAPTIVKAGVGLVGSQLNDGTGEPQ